MQLTVMVLSLATTCSHITVHRHYHRDPFCWRNLKAGASYHILLCIHRLLHAHGFSPASCCRVTWLWKLVDVPDPVGEASWSQPVPRALNAAHTLLQHACV